jgi:hypothetical protein
METKRETPSTLMSLMLTHPPFYELRRSIGYSGLIWPYSIIPGFFNFKTDALYQFPLIDAQNSPNEIHALISSSLFTYSKSIDINHQLEELHKNSPFKKSLHFNRISVSETSNLQSNFDLFSESFIGEDSDLLDSSSVISYIFNLEGQMVDEKDRETICNLLTGFHRKPENINNLNSLTPASSFIEPSCSESFESRGFNERFKALQALQVSKASLADSNSKFSNISQKSSDFSMSLAEEGKIQSIKVTAESQASKNLWGAFHPKPDLFRLAPKDLTSLNSPFTSLVQEVTYYHPSSPIVRKLVFCRGVLDSQDTLEIASSVGTSGFNSALNLEFSNIEIQNKAYADHSKSEKFLLNGQISRAISKNSAVWLSCGFEHCALVTSSGKIMTWGYGASGCLGHGDTLSAGFPRLVQSIKNETFRYVECGGYHSLAISDNSELFVWGRGDVNQLGLPHRLLARDEHGLVALKPVKLEAFEAVVRGAACGEAHTLVLDEIGNIHAFGWADDGQLGFEPDDSSQFWGIRKIPHQFEGHVVKVAAGLVFSACLTDTGFVFVWGSADKGQFGKEMERDYYSQPVKIKVSDVVDLVCGESRVICLNGNGDVFGWGLGKAGHFSHDFVQFAPGSEVVCNSIKLLAETDVVHHVII